MTSWLLLLPLLVLGCGAMVAHGLPEDLARRVGRLGSLLACLATLSVAFGHPLGLLPAEGVSLAWPAAPAAPWLVVDALSAPFVVGATLQVTVLLWVAPRRFCGAREVSRMLALTVLSLVAFQAADPVGILLGWAGQMLVLHRDSRGRPDSGPAARASALWGGFGVSCFAGALVVIALDRGHLGLDGSLHVGTAASFPISAVLLLLLAIVVREGVLPLHSWVPAVIDRGHLGLSLMVGTTQLGAYTFVRLSPVLHEHAAFALPVVADLALVTAVYAALVGLAQDEPRRWLAFLILSQSAYTLVGLRCANIEGVAGALVQCFSMTLAATGLGAVLWALEARGGRLSLAEHHGLARQCPRMSTMFLICGLSAVGLPGTLGFIGEDMLLHGVLESYPGIGVALLVASALNAIAMLRLYGRIFLGTASSPTRWASVRDLLPRERWALSVVVAGSILGGLVPAPVTTGRARAAAALVRDNVTDHRNATSP